MEIGEVARRQGFAIIKRGDGYYDLEETCYLSVAKAGACVFGLTEKQVRENVVRRAMKEGQAENILGVFDRCLADERGKGIRWSTQEWL